MISLIVVYVMGLITGAIAMLIVTFHIGSKSLEAKKKKLSESSEKKMSINERMKRVKEITNQQLDLAQQADGPQKNALHGKHKNGLIGEMKRLDEEKMTLLKSILADGHDPELTTMDEAGVVSKMKLSEYLAYLGVSMDKTTTPTPTEKPKATQIGKFTVIRGGKDDGGKPH